MTGQVGGAGGCNRLSGSYQVNGEQLSLGPVTSTMLDLLDSSGKTVARLVAVHLK